jgi:transposase
VERGLVIQIAPQVRILVAIEAIDCRKGIDRIAQLCREKLNDDPFSGHLFIFRSRRGTSIRILQFDGQGFWLATKRLSKGRFKWWPAGDEAARGVAGAPGAVAAGGGQPRDRSGTRVAEGELRQNPCVLIFLLACCSYAGNVALPRTGNLRRADCVSERVHPDTSGQQPLEAVTAVVRSPRLEAG